jgi:hypothetical protein
MAKRDYKGELEEYLAYAPLGMGLSWTIEAEYRFHPKRKWRFDWIWLDELGDPVKIAIEYDGIMFGHASHSSLAGILRDAEKTNEAQALGWMVFRANAKSVENGTFFALLDNVLLERARLAA